MLMIGNSYGNGNIEVSKSLNNKNVIVASKNEHKHELSVTIRKGGGFGGGGRGGGGGKRGGGFGEGGKGGGKKGGGAAGGFAGGVAGGIIGGAVAN
ncbi:hypothetical protein L195_g035832, partial [Trifolium pratense]